MTNESALTVWFDENMLDKVLFNLLSNAFKFTKDGGLIHVNILKEGDKEVIIRVQDNGLGMSEESVRNAFTVFHQGDYETQKGSGLGLALSKQLINLHKGSITLTSERLKGTTFEIRLPLGKNHLHEQDFVQHEGTPFSVSEDVKIYTTELQPEAVTITDVEGVKSGKEYSILIIEDNADLRGFLKNRLSSEYEILEAEDGSTGLQQGFDTIPDVIIADIVIPKKNGIELVNIFKTDVRTSHIPVLPRVEPSHRDWRRRRDGEPLFGVLACGTLRHPNRRPCGAGDPPSDKRAARSSMSAGMTSTRPVSAPRSKRRRSGRAQASR